MPRREAVHRRRDRVGGSSSASTTAASRRIYGFGVGPGGKAPTAAAVRGRLDHEGLHVAHARGRRPAQGGRSRRSDLRPPAPGVTVPRAKNKRVIHAQAARAAQLRAAAPCRRASRRGRSPRSVRRLHEEALYADLIATRARHPAGYAGQLLELRPPGSSGSASAASSAAVTGPALRARVLQPLDLRDTVTEVTDRARRTRRIQA